MSQENDRHLPDGWQWVKLRDVCEDIYRYPSFYGMEHLSKGVPVIRVEHINSVGEISNNWNNYWFVSNQVSEKFPRTILKKGDLIFTVRGTIGKVGIVREEHENAQISPNLIRISPSSYIKSLYLWYYFQSIKGTENAIEDNTVTVATVKASDLISLKIPLPPLSEQKRIAAILNEQMEAVEKARKATEAQLEAAKALPAAYLRAVFESEEANSWERRKLGDVCDPTTGIYNPKLTPLNFFKYVDISSIDNTNKKITDAKTILGKDAPSRARKIIYNNDVLVATTRPNLNSVALVDSVFDQQVCSTGFCVLRADKNLDHIYLFKYVQSQYFVNNLSNLVKGSMYPAVTDSQVREQLIPLPPLSEQKRIAAILNEQMEAVEKARKATEAQLEAINKLPAVLLRRAFKGEL